MCPACDQTPRRTLVYLETALSGQASFDEPLKTLFFFLEMLVEETKVYKLAGLRASRFIVRASMYSLS